MKRTFFLSFLIVFFIISFMSLVGFSKQNLTKEQSSVSENKVKVDYELQTKCGIQSSEWFKKEKDNRIISNEEKSEVITYYNHYNKKMNKCFIVIEVNGFMTKDNKSYHYITEYLFDVNENKKYGFLYNLETTSTGNVLEKECKSKEEWDKLVKPYMEE